MSSHLRLGHPKGLFPVDVPVKILKVLLPSSILAIIDCSRFINYIVPEKLSRAVNVVN